ncbi:MAG TPA: glycosyltransferase family 39 protein [Solirubrobacteraceae bacterium]|jgi:4-amino-4-deoxy-L-arabinose transferase-like glycosyltransferase|nr:glycosyltransferase family 39 protein [Solirubrobacteraceae bacterium]
MSAETRRGEWLAIGLIALAAGALRLADLGSVRLDPFYDAAVRSMGRSWQNFFLGAFDPGGSTTIDKPPVDLWLQVASVKLFGFNSTALKLPQALAGTLAVPLLYDAVRRPFGAAAGLAGALALAVLPIAVITARSDTMDAVMMMLIVLALHALVRACDTGGAGPKSTRRLLLAAAALGLAFNVKLLESLVALPGLLALAWLGLGGLPASRRLVRLLAAGAVLVAVSLSWLGATLLFPAHERPWAIGSTNGSAWNAAFVFNGLDRIEGKAIEGPQTGFQVGHDYPQATQAQRDAIPITPPSATRLLDRIGPLSGLRLGLEILAALLLGLPAVALTLRGPPLARALGIGLVVWLATGIALFSSMARLHPRYTDAFTPAVAALLGIGAAWACGFGPWAEREGPARAQLGGLSRGLHNGGRGRLLVLAGALAILTNYAAHLLYGTPPVWWVMLAAGVGAVVVAIVGSRSRDARPAPGLRVAALVLTLVALLAIPLRTSVEAIETSASDAGAVGALPTAELVPLSAYLRAHQGSTRYEVATDSATRIAALIVKDARPVVMLTSYEARPLTTLAQLRALITRGEVRYAFIASTCGPGAPRGEAACAPAAVWVREHGIDVSRAAGLPRARTLWELPER